MIIQLCHATFAIRNTATSKFGIFVVTELLHNNYILIGFGDKTVLNEPFAADFRCAIHPFVKLVDIFSLRWASILADRNQEVFSYLTVREKACSCS